MQPCHVLVRALRLRVSTFTRHSALREGIPYFLRLKNSTSCSCFFAASSDLNVPRFFRLPVLGSFFFEYKRYSPDFSFRIILTLLLSSVESKSLRSTLWA